MNLGNICENCNNFIYDEEYEEYYCDRNMDEDEYYRFITSDKQECPYFQSNNEYLIVRKQI